MTSVKSSGLSTSRLPGTSGPVARAATVYRNLDAGMSIERINPTALSRPRGFSHAVVGEGRVVFLAGQTALDAAGRTLSQLASLTVYAVDLADYRAHARDIGLVWRRLAGSDYPAMAAVGVTRLWDEGALVELQGFAILDGRRRRHPPMT